MGNHINLREYLLIFKRRKWIIASILVLSVFIGINKAQNNNESISKTYRSETRIRINTAKGQDVEFSMGIVGMNQSISNTYLQLATSKKSLDETIKVLKLNIKRDELKSKISVTADESNSEFIDITVTDTKRERSEKIAKQIPKSFGTELKIYTGLDCVEVVDKVETEDVAVITGTSGKSTMMKMIIVGVVASVFIVFTLEFLSNKILTPQDIEEYLGLQVIGVVPYNKPKKKKKIDKQEVHSKC